MKTPISHQFNIQAGAKFAEFASWQMPTFYTSVLQEHRATREHIGVFDVSHMGRWMLDGPQSAEFLEYLTTNALSKIQSGRALYTLLLNEHGGIIDDLIIYQITATRFLIVNNAGNHSVVSSWFDRYKSNYNIQLEDITLSCGQIAIQGPHAKAAVEELLGLESSIKYFHLFQLDSLLIAATGYTGEPGYEIYGDPSKLMMLWNSIIERHSALPCGLGSRDLLRLEAGYLLHGSDMDSKTTPSEAGLDWVLSLDKEFIGKASCTRVKHKLHGLKFASKLLPRHGMEVFDSQNNLIGYISSGNFSPILNTPIAFAYLSDNHGDQVWVKIRDQLCPASLCSTRFYSKKL